MNFLAWSCSQYAVAVAHESIPDGTHSHTLAHTRTHKAAHEQRVGAHMAKSSINSIEHGTCIHDVLIAIMLVRCAEL